MKRRLDQYFDLPSPTDIQAKFQNDATAIKRSHAELQSLRDQLMYISESHKQLLEEKGRLEVDNNRLNSENVRHQGKTNELDVLLTNTQRNLETSESRVFELEQQFSISEAMKRDAQTICEKLEIEVTRYKDFYKSIVRAVKYKKRAPLEVTATSFPVDLNEEVTDLQFDDIMEANAHILETTLLEDAIAGFDKSQATASNETKASGLSDASELRLTQDEKEFAALERYFYIL